MPYVNGIFQVTYPRDRLQEELHAAYRSGRVTMRFEQGKLQYLGTEADRIIAEHRKKTGGY